MKYYTRLWGAYGKELIGPFPDRKSAFDAGFAAGARRWKVYTMSQLPPRLRAMAEAWEREEKELCPYCGAKLDFLPNWPPGVVPCGGNSEWHEQELGV